MIGREDFFINRTKLLYDVNCLDIKIAEKAIE